MLSIRMQRIGRKGHAMYRVVVQESRLTPTSGKVVAMLGSYDPHTKVVVLKKDKASFYLQNGAQPSDRAASLMQKEGIDMPKWVKLTEDKKRATRSPEKLRKNQLKAETKPDTVPAVNTEKTAQSDAVDAPKITEVDASTTKT